MARDDPEWQIVFQSLFELATITFVKLAPYSDFIDIGMRKRAVKAMVLSEIDRPEE